MMRNHNSSISRITSRGRILATTAAFLFLVTTAAGANPPPHDHGGGKGEDVVFDVLGFGEFGPYVGQSNPESSSKLETIDRLIVRGTNGLGIPLRFLSDPLNDPPTLPCFPDPGNPGFCAPIPGPSGGCTTIIDSDGLSVTITVPVNGFLLDGSGPVDYRLTMLGSVQDDPFEVGNWLPGVHAGFEGNDDVDLIMESWSVEAVGRKNRRSDCGGAGNFDVVNGTDYFTVSRVP